MTDRELLKQALEALDYISRRDYDDTPLHDYELAKMRPAMSTLRERLAQPEPEPVTDEEKLIDLLEAARETFKKSPSGSECYHNAAYVHSVLETMLIKREWQGLTENEMKKIADTHLVYQVETPEMSGVFDLIRAVSEKLKEKND